MSRAASPETRRFGSFEEFWPFYVAEHGRTATRALHFAGTTAGLLLVAGSLWGGKPVLLLAALLVAYGLAWAGHFAIERNRPATFRYPIWSLQGDFRMYGLMWRGRMSSEIERLRAIGSAAAGPAAGRGSV
jgi:hypothetical protein